MTIDDAELQIKAKINNLKKIVPSYGAGGSFTYGKAEIDEDKISPPDILNSAADFSQSALQLITNQ